MPTDLNYYQLLDLTPAASSVEIHDAYRQQSKIYHPDTTRLAKDIATQKFQLLNEAYGTLSNPDLRKSYDYQLGLTITQKFSPYHSQQFNFRPETSFVDAQERPFSAGELFALLILSLTFLGCLILALVLGIARGEMMFQDSPLADVDLVNHQETFDVPLRTGPNQSELLRKNGM